MLGARDETSEEQKVCMRWSIGEEPVFRTREALAGSEIRGLQEAWNFSERCV